MTSTRGVFLIPAVTLGCLWLAGPARAQESAPAPGCEGPPRVWNVSVDVDANGDLVYRDGNGDVRTLHVCPNDEIVWSGAQDDDQLTISFTKPNNDQTPADDGQMQTSNQHIIKKHIKRRHGTGQYSYTMLLTRGGMEYVDDLRIVIGPPAEAPVSR